MKNLNECIDYHNHYSTMPIIPSYMIDRDIIFEHEPYYEDSISLNTILNSFGIAYKKFKEDYNELPKFTLGEKFEFLNYDNQYNRHMTLYIEKPTFTDKECVLDIFEVGNDIETFMIFDDDIRSVKASNMSDDEKELLRKYMDFLDKQVWFIECYIYSKKNITYGRCDACIKFEYPEDLYTGLNGIRLHVLLEYKGDRYYATIMFNLNDMSIDYDNSTIEGITGNKKEVIDMILNGIYINRERFAYSYEDDSSEEIRLRLKKGLDI